MNSIGIGGIGAVLWNPTIEGVCVVYDLEMGVAIGVNLKCDLEIYLYPAFNGSSR